MRHIPTIFIVLAVIATNTKAETADSTWTEYPASEAGFTVALPSSPTSRLLQTPSPDQTLRVYEAFEPSARLSKFSVFVGHHAKHGVFESASMDAYLSGHIKGMVAGAENGKLQFSRRVTFRGHPALEYRFSHRDNGQPYIARGVTFMIDGGHMRVSMWHPINEPKSEEDFKRFLGSFRLTALDYIPAEIKVTDLRGISFSPPKGWIREPPQNAAQIARFTHLTRSMHLLAAGTAAYSCDNLQAEAQASGRLKDISAVQLGDQRFKKLLTFEDVPKYKVRLTTVHYCINSRLGAVILTATEEESMFPRWAQVFEKAAASVRVQ